MHKIAAETDDVVKNVYLIFRVFYLDTQDIGLRVYSDPGELKFVEESYNATPKVWSSWYAISIIMYKYQRGENALRIRFYEQKFLSLEETVYNIDIWKRCPCDCQLREPLF